MSRYETQLFGYLNALEHRIRMRPLNLGGASASGGGAGGPPGGFLGFLPQTKVSYDLTEAALSGFVQPGAINASGIVVSGSLLDNLNHIRYRIEILEAETGRVVVKENNVVVASGVTILNFTNAQVTDDGGGQVSIVTSGGGAGASTFLGLSDTPSSYISQAGKSVIVNGTENGLIFSSIASDSLKVKVSATDTTEEYLEDKISSGDNVTIQTLDIAGVEYLSISATTGATNFIELGDVPTSYTGQAGKFLRVNSTPNGLEFATIEERHTIQDEGTPLTSRPNLNFTGAGVTVTDNPGNNATDVTIAISGGGGGGAPGFQNLSVPAGSGIINWNLALGSAYMQIDGPYTLNNPTNYDSGEFYFLKVQQGANGTGTITWGDEYWFPKTLTPSLTTVPSGIDIIDFRSDGTYLYGNHVGTRFTNLHVPTLTVTANLEVWLRPEELAAAYTNGDPIGTWTDHSGNGNSMTQSSTARPTYIANVLNGFGVARFDATDDSLIGTASFSNPFTLFIVYSYRSASSSARRALNGSNNWLVGPRFNQHQYYNGAFIAGPSVTQNDFVLCTVIQNGSGADFRVDKTSEGTNAQTTTPGTLHLAYYGDTPELLDGDVAEVLGYSAELSTADITSVEDYLWEKYDLASN